MGQIKKIIDKKIGGSHRLRGAQNFVFALGAKIPHFLLSIIFYLLSIYYLQHSWYDIPNPNIYHKKERSILTTNEKIAALRAAAKAAGADGVLIMTSDPHCSEYLPGYYNALPWFSGFIGENSTLVVTQDRSALWCDGRFYVQADRQLAGSEIECMHAGSAGVPTVAEYLENHFAQGETLLLDGSCVPATIAREYRDALAKKGAALKSLDVASPIWDATGERPALPDTPCNLLTPAQTGATAADRITAIDNGTVIQSLWTPETGYIVVLQHAGNLISVYKNLSQSLVTTGQTIRSGELIGYNAEVQDGEVRLFEFELWNNGKPVDPEGYIVF